MEGVVAAGVVEHVEVGGGREEGLVLPALVLGLLFFLRVEWVVDEEPFGLAGDGVVVELEDAWGVGHGGGVEVETLVEEKLVIVDVDAVPVLVVSKCKGGDVGRGKLEQSLVRALPISQRVPPLCLLWSHASHLQT